MGRIGREVSDLKRLDEIIRTIADQEMGVILDRLDLKHRLPFTKRFSTRDKKPKPERLRDTLEELGPTFIKFGQIMAQRPDIVPESYRKKLEELEDAVSPCDPEESKRIIEEDIGNIEENFREFEDEPMAAASIAQVHEATLESGEEVIVKVRRPDIKEKVERDLDIMEFLAKRAEGVSSTMKQVRFEKLVEEFDKWITGEMNLEREGRNAEIIKGNMEDEDRVKIPEVYSQYTTERVLVMEKVTGIKCTEEEKLEELDVEVADITRTGIRMGLKQVIRDGFFHADPHPSNFFIDDEGRIILIDFGMVGKLTKKTREQLGILFLHIANEDVDSAVDVIQNIGRVSDDADIEEFKEDVEEMILMLRNSKVKDNTLTRTMLDMVVRASRRGVYLPTSLVLTGKALVTIEGILLTINPEAQLTTEYRDQVEDILKEQNSMKDLGKSFMIDFYQNKDILTKAPSKISKLLEKEERNTNVQVQNNIDHREEIVVSGLLLAGVFLLAQTLPSNSMKILGSAFLILALVLFSNRI